MNSHNMTFYELLCEYNIQIPIIQRDYAQGRTDNSDICINFLTAVLNSIKNNKIINLDFIYGSIKEKNFFPLDGQQRLTTLFLLHWYAFAKQKKSDDDIKKNLKKFSYETRISSRRFCESLVEHFDNVIENSECPLSSVIMDSEWFFMSWQQDPTIKAMLNSLDIIHTLFSSVENLWDILVTKKSVTFYVLILEHFGLSDDLYIKMNARGKLLTPFENFKAELVDLINKNNWEEHIEFASKFSTLIDRDWMDFLWNLHKKENNDNKSLVDDAHMRFITVIIMLNIAIRDMGAQEKQDIIRKLNENSSERQLITYITSDTYHYLYDSYTVYSKIEQSIPEINFDMWRHKKNFLSQIFHQSNSSYNDKILFYAQTEYLLKHNKIDEEKFLNWMRVIRNIISRADITADGKRSDIVRSPEAFYGAVNLIRELSEGCDDIYKFLAEKGSKLSSKFAKEQIDEEIIKARIITEHNDHKNLLFSLEDNLLLKGRILPCMKFAGFSDSIDEIDFDYLSEIQKVFAKYFNEDLDSKPEEFDLLRRVMLTLEVNGEYCFYNYWWSYWYAGEAEKRKLFSNFNEIEFFINRGGYEYFKKLIEKLCKADYQTIIDNFEKPAAMKNWQYRLIKESELLSNCHSKYIAVSSDRKSCYLLKSKRTSDVKGSPLIE